MQLRPNVSLPKEDYNRRPNVSLRKEDYNLRPSDKEDAIFHIASCFGSLASQEDIRLQNSRV